jgi:CRISPR-associated protein Csh2
MDNKFNNRVFGCAIIRSINANYNADFSHQPRTLPNGVCYATDKALKYLIKNYLLDNNESVFYYKRSNSEFQPLRLEDAYNVMFKRDKPDKATVANDLLSCLDIRCFGATFAMKAKGGDNIAISIHGPVQINHGVNIWSENNIFSEQIMSPFADKEGADATTLGRQSKLQEGHYLHHFSINPKNIQELAQLANNAGVLTTSDIDKLKEAMRCSASYFDSAAKAGIDNEALVWVKLKEGAKNVLPTFNNLIKLTKENEKIILDFSAFTNTVARIAESVENIEIHYLQESVFIKNEPSIATHHDIVSGLKILIA